MPYTVQFSDTNKTPLTVADGAVNVDTSLQLVGKNSSNFGSIFATNFVHLLENFSKISSPNNPVEGQLWFDTSDPFNKSLKVYDGAYWRTTSNIYKSSNDPNEGLRPSKDGDLWVDTVQLKLKMFRNGQWESVGFDYNSSSKTGTFAEQIFGTDNNNHDCVVTYLNNDIISVHSKEKFTPNPIITGFTEIVPGLNISSATYSGTASTIAGLANTALNLKVTDSILPISADNFLRTDTAGTIDGFLNINSNAGIKIGAFNQTFLLEKQLNDGIIQNRVTGGGIRFRSWKNNEWNEVLSVDGNNFRVGIYKQVPTTTLDVGGNANIDGRLNIGSTANNSLVTGGGTAIGSELRVGTYLTVATTASIGGKVVLGTTSGFGTIIEPANTSTYDLGSRDKPFRTIYAQSFSNTATIFQSVSTGMIIPWAGAVLPDGYLECNGAEVNGNVYYALKNVLSTTYGIPIVPTGVVLPDLRTKYLITDNGGASIKFIIKY